jgi:hypothetical protein
MRYQRPTLEVVGKSVQVVATKLQNPKGQFTSIDADNLRSDGAYEVDE